MPQHTLTDEEYRALKAFIYRGGGASEDLAITIDPASGRDPAPGAMLTQAEITAHGAFKSFDGVTNALPTEVGNVTITVKDGAWTLRSLGDWRRIRVRPNKQITIQSESILKRTSGTATYALASAAAGTFVFAVDPGFGVDAHKSRFVRVVSGLGAGQYRPIGTHTGVNGVIAGRWGTNPNNTSVVEIVEPAALITLPDDTDVFGPGVQSFGQLVADSSQPSGIRMFNPFRIRGIEFRCANAMRWIDMDVWIDAVKIEMQNVGFKSWDLMRCNVHYEAFVFKGPSPMFLVGSCMAPIAFQIGWLVCDITLGDAISLYSIFNQFSTVSMLTLIDMRFQANSGGVAVSINGPGSFVYMRREIRGTNTNTFVVKVADGGRFQGALNDDQNYPAGVTSDLQVDGVNSTWANLDAQVGDRILGVEGSLIKMVAT